MVQLLRTSYSIVRSHWGITLVVVTKYGVIREQGQFKKKVAVLIFEALFYGIISIISAAVTERTKPALLKYDCLMHENVRCSPLPLTFKVIFLSLQKSTC